MNRLVKAAGPVDPTWTGTRFQKWIVETARLNGWTVRVMDQRNSRGVLRAQSMDQKGWPDLILLCEGILAYVETKSRGENLSAIQQYRHQQLRNAGQRVIVAKAEDWEEVMDLISSRPLVHP